MMKGLFAFFGLVLELLVEKAQELRRKKKNVAKKPPVDKTGNAPKDPPRPIPENPYD